MTRLEIVPLERDVARAFVAAHHRHSEPPVSHRFSIGLERDGELVGVVIAGRPIARGADDGRTIELLRVATLGDRNACSRLYGAACRAAAAMGYRRAITYTLASEPGSSLRAAGFSIDAELADRGPARQWPVAPRLFDPPKIPTGPKIRWARALE